jgi:hypothetical protein
MLLGGINLKLKCLITKFQTPLIITKTVVLKLQTFIIQYTFKKIECMFVNVPSKLQCSTVVFMKVSRSEPFSLTCLQLEITLLYGWVATLLVYF